MKVSLRAKLSLSYVFVALLSMLLISIVTNRLLDRHFREYIIENQERKVGDIVSQVSRLYSFGGKWDREAIETICINALKQGMIIKVVDSTGETVWDARNHDNEQCEMILAHMESNMSSRYPNWEGKYVEHEYIISNVPGEAAKVTVGYYGPYYFSDSDLDFINTINRLLLAVGAFSIVISFILGSVMAKRISMPISRAIDTARMISKGYFSDRITERSGTKEIAQLTETINELAENLENQEALRKRLTADVAHELRTPLATLQSHMEAMIDGIWEPDAGRLRSCHEEIMRISRLVGDIEKLAKYESENLVLVKTEFDISELVQNIVRNFESDFASKGIHLGFAGEKVTVAADRDKIGQVMVNLLSNAQKYTGIGGEVRVIVRGTDEAAEITVKDTGEGIPPEDLPHIFERFYRADKSRNRLTGGAGIGLTITKAIVDAHRGKIYVESNLNEGTEINVILPKHVG